MQRVQRDRANRDLVTVEDLAVERHRFERPEPCPARLLAERAVEREIGRVQEARTAAALAQRPERTDMVEVRVRVQQVARPQRVGSEARGDSRDVVAAVDHDRLSAGRITENRAVAR